MVAAVGPVRPADPALVVPPAAPAFDRAPRTCHRDRPWRRSGSTGCSAQACCCTVVPGAGVRSGQSFWHLPSRPTCSPAPHCFCCAVATQSASAQNPALGAFGGGFNSVPWGHSASFGFGHRIVPPIFTGFEPPWHLSLETSNRRWSSAGSSSAARRRRLDAAQSGRLRLRSSTCFVVSRCLESVQVRRHCRPAAQRCSLLLQEMSTRFQSVSATIKQLA